jgi:arabinofuranosyltransferase
MTGILSATTQRVDRRTAVGPHVATILFIAFFVTVVLRTAWVADDAFVDLRTVSNVVAGAGLRWNLDERVQAFSDPLWVLLVSAVTFLVHQPYGGVLITSIVLAVAAVVILGSQVAVDAYAAIVGVSLLTFSRSFVEYATSGLQTPLVYLLVVVFWLTYLRQEDEVSQMRRLIAIASLVVLTDWASLLVLVPALVVAARRWSVRASDAIAGVWPLIVWAMFALSYYGVLIPTPVVAAWHALGPPMTMVHQGCVYLLDAIDTDPSTVLTISVAMISGFRVRELRPAAIGLMLSIGATILTGGSALSGRELAVPLLSAVVIAVRYPWQSPSSAFTLALAGVVGVGLIAPESPVLTGPSYHRETQPLAVPWPSAPSVVNPRRSAIRDERRQWYASTGLLTVQRMVPMPNMSSLEREADALSARSPRTVDERIGLFAYAAGARLHIIDPSGRTDPFLARQPPKGEWKPGARLREVPPSYVAGSGAASAKPYPMRRAGLNEFSRATIARQPALADRQRRRVGRLAQSENYECLPRKSARRE